ncbi:hypothetical protein PENTCL1PPCAC_17556 [Pristionchus entomophagus]|uniref:Endoplasmic reticulum transmembrane protein n=1 Tax=Pristionchus entomophagus TaxID=358040 RepID=A0AAV5TM20_9BILA|nr:hypothetical protein PENTCL1PPCAC_17556 [Pristionchus entomophagus]
MGVIPFFPFVQVRTRMNSVRGMGQGHIIQWTQIVPDNSYHSTESIPSPFSTFTHPFISLSNDFCGLEFVKNRGCLSIYRVLQSLNSSSFHRRMTIEWSVVAALLYTEIAIILLLLLPWIKPKIWRSIFKSRIGHSIGQYAKQSALIVGGLLFMLFIDAVRSTRKYSAINNEMSGTGTAAADAVVHAHLFHAERNEYITGFSLLLFLVISRIVKMIHRMSDFERSAESALRQAHATSKTVIESRGENEKEKMMKKELEGEISSTRAERDNLLNQAKVLQKEYDEILAKLKKHQA